MAEAMTLRKAERRKARLRMGIAGPSGSGKTLSSLLVAFGIAGEWDKIAVIDTENGSGDLYVGTVVAGVRIEQYSIITLGAPYSPERYVEAIRLCERSGVAVIIIDSLSHAWAGEGGVLAAKDAIAAADKHGNSFAAWRTVTPRHNQLVEAILQSPCHIIATMRSKVEYMQTTDDKGKPVIRKVGLQPIQRDGMEYEFTLFADLDMVHRATASKDRTGILDGSVSTLTIETGLRIRDWLESTHGVPATDEQRRQMVALARDKGINDGAMAGIIRERFGVESSRQLTQQQADDLLAELGAKA